MAQSLVQQRTHRSEPSENDARRGRILIVDDEANARAALSEILQDEGYVTESAGDGFKALARLEEFAPDVVLTDLKMPGLDGVAFMEKAKRASPETVFVVMTAFGTISSAVAAIKMGAENYLTKPLDYEALAAVVERAMEKANLRQETRSLRERLRERNVFGHIIADDPTMRAIVETVAQAGPSKANVLITGESGTGKQLIAKALCAASSNPNAPFVRLHCGDLSEALLESELFGHERGALPGAAARLEGRFLEAHEGTLFFDEVADLPLGIQAKLMHFMQEKTFVRVGGTEALQTNARLVAATRKDLRAEIQRGTFREDLYYRLNVISIDLPPLRQRRGDIGPLATFFLSRSSKNNGRNVSGITDRALRVLSQYDWPGNVRELGNMIERAVVLCDSREIDIRHLSPSLAPSEGDRIPAIPGSTIQDLEKYAILKTLEACGGATSKAAIILGISPRKIQYKLHEYSS